KSPAYFRPRAWRSGLGSRLLKGRLIDPPVVVGAAAVTDKDVVVAEDGPGEGEAVGEAGIGNAVLGLREVALQVVDERLALLGIELTAGFEDLVIDVWVTGAIALAVKVVTEEDLTGRAEAPVVVGDGVVA